MINNKINISRFNGEIPCCTNRQCRRISGGPIYNKDEVLLLSKGQKIQLWTKGSINDAQKWGLDIDNLAEMIIHAILEGKFKHSEWCIQKDNGPWAACDVYTFTWIEFDPCRYRKIATGFYLKFAISKTGQMLLTVSIHPEGA